MLRRAGLQAAAAIFGLQAEKEETPLIAQYDLAYNNCLSKETIFAWIDFHSLHHCVAGFERDSTQHQSVV